MKLAFCLTFFFPYGGMQRDFIRIARECHRRGHEITVFAYVWEGDVPDWVNLRRIPIRARSNHRLVREFAAKVQQALLQEQYDVVVGFNKIPGLDVYFAADSCFVAKRQYRHALMRINPRYRIYAELERAVFAKDAHTKILAISPTETAKYKHHYHTPSSRFVTLPPGVNEDRKPPQNVADIRHRIRQQWGITDEQFLLVSVGSQFRIKGVDRTLKALASLPVAVKEKTHLIVIGHEKKLPVYQKLVNKLGLQKHVHFLGAREDVPDFLFAADLLVHVARTENTGAAIVEGLVAGVGVLVTGNCGYAYFVKEAHAGEVLPEPFQQKRLNAALLGVLDKSKLGGFGQRAKAYVEKEDMFSLISAAVDVIEESAREVG